LCFFWWSLAPDLRFSLGQTNTRRVFRYTGKGFYLESDRSIFYTPGGGTTAGSNAPGAFLVFIIFHFFGGHLPQTSDFARPNKYLSRLSLHRFRARILGGRNIFCTLGDGLKRRGLMPLGLFLFTIVPCYVVTEVDFTRGYVMRYLFFGAGTLYSTVYYSADKLLRC